MAVDQHQHIQPPDPCCSFSWQPVNPKWNTNQEIYQILCNARMHPEIFTNTVIERPASGTQLLFARHDGNWFKNDGYEWRRRKGGRLIREDHMDLKVDSLLANSLYPNPTQLAAQLAPIYRYSLENNIIQQVSEEIVNTLHSLQSEQVQHQQQTGSSHSTSSSNRHLERRNSCSSAFRKGLSSLALRRQPSTFSDSIDVNFAGLTPNSCSCGNERQPIVGISGNHRNSLDVANLHNASSSPSGATTKSSNLDEESLCLQQSISGSPVPASQTQFSSNQTPITDITPISGSSKGGTKVLIIGSFFMKGHEYSVQFGERRVPARLVQVGVLSLFSPPSTSSKTVPLIVYCNNQQVSTSSEFTYMDDATSSNTDSLQNLLDRIQILLSALYPFDNSYNEPLSYVDESALLRLLERKSQSNQNQRSSNLSLLNSNLLSRTVFHYAALLNYPNLIRFLLNLRTSFGYNRELNPLSRDVEGLTALHLAMRMGHLECAKIIIKECRESLDVLDDRGRTPGDLAGDEKMRRLAEKQNFINVHEKSSKEDHVSPTELWVMTNGETVTREHLLLKERVPLQKSPMGEEPVSSFSMLSDADGNEGQPGNDRGNWRDDTPLHVEISMDTNVFVPDSPKMADLFEAVTSPGIEITDVDRERMAQLAKQIIEAIPPRIKNQESMSLIEDDISNAFYHNHYNSPLLSQHGPNQVSEFDNFFDHEYSHHRYDHTDNSSSLSAQPSGSSFDHNRLHPNTTRDGSFSNESSRANTFESTSFDFDK
ncbi:hypothetical protein WR25_17818 [Diploscapter pachys]|uniref:CG-1 domain-containing protein n=1 Tax=Diploscapter pachys TaxID=2018661 RepID=A0A2A2KN45_9BILA|nr:hypothetical protein WR25_17818 [Diploscapter pachys]